MKFITYRDSLALALADPGSHSKKYIEFVKGRIRCLHRGNISEIMATGDRTLIYEASRMHNFSVCVEATRMGDLKLLEWAATVEDTSEVQDIPTNPFHMNCIKFCRQKLEWALPDGALSDAIRYGTGDDIEFMVDENVDDDLQSVLNAMFGRDEKFSTEVVMPLLNAWLS